MDWTRYWYRRYLSTRRHARAWAPCCAAFPASLGLRSTLRFERPVMLPPGRARLLTEPAAHRIPCADHYDRDCGGRFFRRDYGVDPAAATMTSTLRLTNSVARPGRRSLFPSAERHSINRFFPRHSQARACPAGTGRSSSRSRKSPLDAVTGNRRARFCPAVERKRERRRERTRAKRNDQFAAIVHATPGLGGQYARACWRTVAVVLCTQTTLIGC